jgi:hypothetical protein
MTDEDEDKEPATVVSGYYVPPPAIMVDLTMVDTDEDDIEKSRVFINLLVDVTNIRVRSKLS